MNEITFPWNIEFANWNTQLWGENVCVYDDGVIFINTCDGYIKTSIDELGELVRLAKMFRYKRSIYKINKVRNK